MNNKPERVLILNTAVFLFTELNQETNKMVWGWKFNLTIPNGISPNYGKVEHFGGYALEKIEALNDASITLYRLIKTHNLL